MQSNCNFCPLINIWDFLTWLLSRLLLPALSSSSKLHRLTHLMCHFFIFLQYYCNAFPKSTFAKSWRSTRSKIKVQLMLFPSALDATYSPNFNLQIDLLNFFWKIADFWFSSFTIIQVFVQSMHVEFKYIASSLL